MLYIAQNMQGGTGSGQSEAELRGKIAKGCLEQRQKAQNNFTEAKSKVSHKFGQGNAIPIYLYGTSS